MTLSFFMDENDLKFLIAAYQSKSADLLSQVVAAEAKNMKLQQIVEALSKQVQELEAKATKPKRSTKSTQEFE